MKEINQDLKTKIGKIKKTQAKKIIETEIMSKQSGTTNSSMNSRIQVMEERISRAEITIEEIELLVKENIKSSTKLNTKYPGNLGYHVKTKPKNNMDRKRRKSSTQKHRKYIQPNLQNTK